MKYQPYFLRRIIEKKKKKHVHCCNFAWVLMVKMPEIKEYVLVCQCLTVYRKAYTSLQLICKYVNT